MDQYTNDHRPPVDPDGEPAPPTANAWPDPDTSLLDDRRGDLPGFPIDLLPAFWRHWCERAADGAGAPVDYVALTMLTASAGLIGGGRLVSPAPSWSDPCVLWGALVGAPSTGKTPAIETSMRLLRALDRGLAPANEERQRQHQAAVAMARARAEQWRGEVAQAAQDGTAVPGMPADANPPPPFAARQLVTMDITQEAIADVLQGNPRGILQMRDELSGWLENMGRYANGGTDRPFWLQAWSASPYTVNRKGKPPVNVARLAISILGTIQPDVLASALTGNDDGLGERFLYAWPNRTAFKPLSSFGQAVSAEALDALARLRDMPDEPRVVPFDRDAVAVFEDFRRDHHTEAAGLDGFEAGWWGKGEGTVLRLAGVWTFLDWAARPAGTPEPQAIGAHAVLAAAGLWHGYFWPHARAVFRAVGRDRRQQDARRVLRWIRTRGAAEVSREAVRRDALGQSLDSAGTDRLMDALVSAGWVRPVEVARGVNGRPPKRWIVNPVLWRADHA